MNASSVFGIAVGMLQVEHFRQFSPLQKIGTRELVKHGPSQSIPLGIAACMHGCIRSY